jgi:hypothetical protein
MLLAIIIALKVSSVDKVTTLLCPFPAAPP